MYVRDNTIRTETLEGESKERGSGGGYKAIENGGYLGTVVNTTQDVTQPGMALTHIWYFCPTLPLSSSLRVSSIS